MNPSSSGASGGKEAPHTKTLRCATCGNVATCIGRYEGRPGDSCACDECCGHGNEDGWCEPLVSGGRSPVPPDPDTIEAIRSNEAVRDAFVECYTLQSIITDERRSNVDQWAMEQWDRVESALIRAILVRSGVSEEPTP